MLTSAAAAVQIAALEEATGSTVPARLQLPGCSSYVMTHKVIALTSERFVNLLSLEGPSSQTQGAPAAGPRKKRCTRSAARATEILQPVAPTQSACNAPSAEAMRHVTAAMNQESPSTLTMAQTLALIEAAKFCMADAILGAMPAYVQPIIMTAPLQQVRRACNLNRVQLCRRERVSITHAFQSVKPS
jgi:hypothetical protein